MEFSKEANKNLIESKIGEIIKKFMPYILENNLISENEIKNLENPIYSKDTFNVNYPILKRYDKSIPKKDNIKLNGGPRYYSKPIKYNSTEFFLTNHWYDYYKENFIDWMKRKIK